MSPARLASLFVGLTGLIPAAAHAGGKVKAHLECSSGLPLKSGKAAKLTDELWCNIAVDSLGSYKAADLTGNLAIIPGKVSTLAQQPEGKGGPLADTQDGVVFQLEGPYLPDKDYKKCEPFEVHAAINDQNLSAEDMIQWSGVFKVNAACPKPKKVAATLKCNYTAQDGTIITWPGNGPKLKARLEGSLACEVASTKAKTEAGVPYEVSIAIAGKGAPAKGGFEHDEAGDPFFDAKFEGDVYESCSNFTVTAEVRASGATLWSGKLAIKQDCPD